MSWVMPIDYMLKKLYHMDILNIDIFVIRKFRKNSRRKKYIFDINKPFNIRELNINDPRIPKFSTKNKYIRLFSNYLYLNS